MMSTPHTRLQAITSHLQPTNSTVTTMSSMHSQSTAATSLKKPLKVVVTGAAGQIAYSLLWMIIQGKLAGDDQPIELRLLDLPVMEKSLQGVAMELLDSASPLVTNIIATSDYKTAFMDVDVALLVGARPRTKDMQRKDLLQANAQIFRGQGKALNDYAARTVKVLVVGNPANTNALIAMANAPDLPKTAFSAMTRLDQNRAVSQIASRVKVPVANVKNVIIWGNHSKTQYPDVNHGVIADYPQRKNVTPIRAAINDHKWLDGEFINVVQDRGAAIINARGKSSAASAASACIDHMRNWILGTAPGEYVSMGVYSDGKTYGVPEGLIYSFPVTCSNGQYTIVRGLQIDAASQARLDETTKELLEEKADAFSK
jgi:malate dehydrogenase